MPRRALLRPAAAMVLVAVTVALAACGGKDGPEAPPSAPPSGDTPAAASPAPPSAPEEPSVTPPAPPAARAPNADGERVVVEVNGQPIRAKKILGAIEMNVARARSMGRSLGPADAAALQQAAFDHFVAEELLYQAAQADGIRPAEAEVAREIKAMQGEFPSIEQYEASRKEAGVTEAEVRAEVARRLAVQSYVKKIAGDTSVPEAEARAVYDANKEQFGVPEQVHAAIIVVTAKPGDPDPLKADARKRIDEARKRAAAGEDFAALAREYSQIPNAARGGDLGFFGRGDGAPPKIEDMAFSTPPGQVSPVFDTPGGFSLLKVLEKSEPRTRPFEEVKAALIGDLGRQKEGRAIEAKIAELRAAAKVDLKDPSLLGSSAAPTR